MPQISTAIGRLGASRQSWRPSSPRDALKTIVETFPRKTEAEILTLFADHVRDNESQLSCIIEYWFANNYRSLMRALAPDADDADKRERAKVEAAARRLVEATVERRAKVKLMALMMPNGKPLAECTGKDCAELAALMGPWLSSLARQLGPSQVVGIVFSEEVSAIYAGKAPE